MIYLCCNEHRRTEVKHSGHLNGIDFLEVSQDQRTLTIHFLKPPKGDLEKELAKLKQSPVNVIITGRGKSRAVLVKKVEFDNKNDKLIVSLDAPGDFSLYTLKLLTAGGQHIPGLDQLMDTVDFSFKVECCPDADCRSSRICPPETPAEPVIDYLNKDFASFRQMMIDRISLLMPQWKERNPADMGIHLIELLAYVGDHLSYQQDAITSEAYVGTARRRISMRRHARLLNYFMHDGCNARVWVHIKVKQEVTLERQQIQFLTTVAGMPVQIPAGTSDHDKALSADAEVFEPMHDATLYAAHNEIDFYLWGEEKCCLPKGATQATLSDPNGALRLNIGDVLIFQEVRDPKTGRCFDADPSHRHAVRLTGVSKSEDALYKMKLVDIQWAREDALPFALHIGEIDDPDVKDVDHAKRPISVALGNIVLADHGRTIHGEFIGSVPDIDPRLSVVQPAAHNRCKESSPVPTPPRFHPRLERYPLTRTGTVNKGIVIDGSSRRLGFDASKPASAAFQWDVHSALPAIVLWDDKGGKWFPQRDLLASAAFAAEFVVETDNDGRATIRFGDDVYGKRPASGVQFTATYRIGNGVRGNIGADALKHIVCDDERVESVGNPMPARGGTEPEDMEYVRRTAPYAFQRQERAVTPEDCARMCERHHEVQRAEAAIRWTGSWYTVFIYVDRTGGKPVDAGFEREMRDHLERYRMAGQDVEIVSPQFVPLEIEAFVCVDPGYFRDDVKAALQEVFSNTIRSNGARGFFHPDNLSFGQPVYLSRLYAAAREVAGIKYIDFTTFRRSGTNDTSALVESVLEIGRLEVAQLDNDPNLPWRGVIRFIMKGGR